MDCEVFIMPRQSGKTTKIITEFLKDPHNSIIVVPNQESVKHIIKTINKQSDINNKILLCRIRSVSSDFLPNIKAKNFFLDEYLGWPQPFIEKFNLDRSFLSSEDAIIKIFTTSKKLYSRNLFDRVKQIRQEGESIYSLANKFENPVREEIIELYCNLITHPNATINAIDYNLERSNKINNAEDFKEKIRKFGIINISVNYEFSDEIIEEFIEEIYWPYYSLLNKLSDGTLKKFKKEIETFSKFNRYNEMKHHNPYQHLECEIVGKLFKI